MLIQPNDRTQTLMFNSIDDFIPDDSPIRFLEILIHHIISENKNKYISKGESDVGRPAYSSLTLLIIYLYGYINRITSSRRLEQETKRNLELIWLTGNLQPDFKTIADFRKDNPHIIEEFGKDLRKLIKDLGLFNTKTIIIDSTKLKANAGQNLHKREEVIERLINSEKELAEYIKKLDEIDSEAKGNDEENEEEKLRLTEEIKRLEIELKKSQEKILKLDELHKNYISETDPDCHLVKRKNSYFPGYNLQVITEPQNHFIISEFLSEYVNDRNDLPLAIEQVKTEYDELPIEIIADTGYSTLDLIQEIEEKLEIECIVPHEKKKEGEITFRYDEEKDVMICSAGKELISTQKKKKEKNNIVNVYTGTECLSCEIRDRCTKSKVGRSVSRYWNENFREAHRKKMRSEESLKKLGIRKSRVEHIFGTMKLWLGYMPLLTRRRQKVLTEIKIFSSAYNIKRLMKIMTIEEFKREIKRLSNKNNNSSPQYAIT